MKYILDLIFNTLNNKLSNFPFYYKLMKATNNWYNGIYFIIFGQNNNEKKFTN